MHFKAKKYQEKGEMSESERDRGKNACYLRNIL